MMCVRTDIRIMPRSIWTDFDFYHRYRNAQLKVVTFLNKTCLRQTCSSTYYWVFRVLGADDLLFTAHNVLKSMGAFVKKKKIY